MRHLILPAALLALSMSAAAAEAPPSASDADLVAKAAVGNTFEVEEAKLAATEATDPRLKDFAQKMIADHGDAEKKLEDVAGKAGQQKPSMKLDETHQAMLDNLKTFKGQDFDKIYTADQVQAHVETVALLSDYKQNGKTSELKSWVNESLPIVKGHLASIDAM